MIADFPVRPSWSGSALANYRGLTLHEGYTLAEAAGHLRGKLVYLATPYSRVVVDERGRWEVGLNAHAIAGATRWACQFARLGVTAAAPITLAGDIIAHDYCRAGGPSLDPLDAKFWEAWCLPLLTRADCVVVPPLPGWRESIGIWRECVAMLGVGRPVYLLREAAHG